jgi:hypothetical protein
MAYLVPGPVMLRAERRSPSLALMLRPRMPPPLLWDAAERVD